MAQLSTKIKLYANQEVDFQKDVILQDDSDGNGAYIKEWNLDIAEPTNTQLASYETAGNTELANYESAGNTAETLSGVLNKRANEYPSVKDQLDKIYHSGIDEWKKVIKATKDKYPKWAK